MLQQPRQWHTYLFPATEPERVSCAPWVWWCELECRDTAKKKKKQVHISSQEQRLRSQLTAITPNECWPEKKPLSIENTDNPTSSDTSSEPDQLTCGGSKFGRHQLPMQSSITQSCLTPSWRPRIWHPEEITHENHRNNKSLNTSPDVSTSVISRFRPSTSSSPGLNSPPGLWGRNDTSDHEPLLLPTSLRTWNPHSLKKVVPSCRSRTCGSRCSWTMRTPSTVLLIPILSNSSRIRWNRAATELSFSYSGSLVPNV